MDSSTLTLSPNKSIHSTVLDTAQQRQHQPQDAIMEVHGESQEMLSGINLSPNHPYTRRRRRQQGSCQDQDNLICNLNKQVPSPSGTKQVQGARHSRIRNTSYSNKNTVRFGHDDDHQVQTIDPIDRKYFDQLYLTEPQRLQHQADAKRVVKHYASAEKKPYVAAIHRILQSHQSNTNTAVSDVVQVMAESAARGLESRISPALKYHRMRTVRAVLALQCELRMSGEKADTTAQHLRNRSLQASRPCRYLARQLGLGDAAAAHIDGPSSPMSSSVLPIVTMPATTTMPMPSLWLREQHYAIVEP
jgi:hypothetical protein